MESVASDHGGEIDLINYEARFLVPFPPNVDRRRLRRCSRGCRFLLLPHNDPRNGLPGTASRPFRADSVLPYSREWHW